MRNPHLVICLFACAMSATAAFADEPRGVYAVIGWNVAPATETWNNPLLDGVVIRTHWKDVQSKPDAFDWSYLDTQFAAAAEHHKHIHLILVPGFYSPAFVLQDPAVKTAPFDVPGGPHHTAAERQPLPLPWDEAYLAHWFAFVERVAERYAGNATLGYVSVTGPNSHNGEVSLPRGEADEPRWLDLAGGDAEVLRKKLTAAWCRTIDHFCTAFHGKRVTLAVITKSLPVTVGGRVEQDYMEGLARYGATRYPDTFGLQTNGLDGTTGDAPAQWELIRSYSGKLLVGFQTREPANLYKGKRHDADVEARRPEVFRQAVLDNGLSRGPDFIEVYEHDADDATLADVLRKAHEGLAR